MMDAIKLDIPDETRDAIQEVELKNLNPEDELLILDKKLVEMEHDDPEFPKTLERRRFLTKQVKIKRLKRELTEVMDEEEGLSPLPFM